MFSPVSNLQPALLGFLCLGLVTSCASPMAEDALSPPAPCTPAAESKGPALDLSDWNVAEAPQGITLAWRPTGGEVRRNQDLQLAVIVLRDGAPLPAAELILRGWMPDHGHGFVQQPRVTAQGEGAFRVDGLRLHMRGAWQLTFEIRASELKETVRFDLEV